MTYTLVWDHMRNQPSDTVIQRDEDGAFIPMDPDNIDCQNYVAWLDEGNEPSQPKMPTTPAIPPAPAPSDAPYRNPVFGG